MNRLTKTIIIILVTILIGAIAYFVIDAKKTEEEINWYKSHGETVDEREQYKYNDYRRK